MKIFKHHIIILKHPKQSLDFIIKNLEESLQDLLSKILQNPRQEECIP